MTHSSATYTAVDDYDNLRTVLHKQLCGATLIIQNSLSDFLYSPHSLSFSYCLIFLAPSLSLLVSMLFFLSQSWLITHRRGAAAEF